MNYQISEEEYDSLESLNGQLGLIAGLLSVANFEPGAITSTDLFAFLNARSGELARVLKAASARHSLQWEQAKQQGAMSWADWVDALRLVSGGALHESNGAVQSITDKLTMAARIDENMQRVCTEWLAALDRASGHPMLTVAQAKPQPRTRKRSHVIANA